MKEYKELKKVFPEMNIIEYFLQTRTKTTLFVMNGIFLTIMQMIF